VTGSRLLIFQTRASERALVHNPNHPGHSPWDILPDRTPRLPAIERRPGQQGESFTIRNVNPASGLSRMKGGNGQVHGYSSSDLAIDSDATILERMKGSR